MIISFIEECDLGISFGIDDDFFKSNQTHLQTLNSTIFKSNPIEFLYEKFEGNQYQNEDLFSFRSFPLGYGIRINLSNKNLFIEWKKGAVLYALKEYADKKNLIGFIESINFKEFYCIFYSIGFVTLQLNIECNFDKNIDYPDLADIINSCDYDYDKYVKDKLNLLILCLEKKEIIGNNNFHKITKRNTVYKELYFSHIFVCKENEVDTEILLEQIKQMNNLKISEQLYWEYDYLYWGYVDSLLITTVPKQSEKIAIIYLIQILNLYQQIALSFEKFIAEKLVVLTKKKIQNNVTIDDIAEINQQKTFLTAILNIGNYSATSSIHVTDMQFFEYFESFHKLTSKQEKLLATFEIFANIQSDFVNIEQAKRDNILNRTLFFLTALTIISVLAAIITTTDYSNNTISNRYIRFVIIVVIPLIFIIGFNFFIKKKIKKR